MKCFFCKSNRIRKSFKTKTEGVFYNICNNCGCHYQKKIHKIDYDKNYWVSTIDPDGKRRCFVNEREDKIKNWYGDAIKFVNNFKNIKVLDLGCGLGFFFKRFK